MRLKNCLGFSGLVQILLFGLIAAQPSRFRSFRQGSRRSWQPTAPRIYHQVPLQRFQDRAPSSRFRTYGERDNSNDLPRLSMPSRRTSFSQPPSFASSQRVQRARTWQQTPQRQPTYRQSPSTSSRHRSIRISSQQQRSVQPTGSRGTRFESPPSVQRSMFVERQPTAYRLRSPFVQSRVPRFNTRGRASSVVTSRQRPSIVSRSRSTQGRQRTIIRTPSQQQFTSVSGSRRISQTSRPDARKIGIPSPSIRHAGTVKQAIRPVAQQGPGIHSQTARKAVQPAVVPVPQKTIVPKAPFLKSGTLQQQVPVNPISRQAPIHQYLPGGKLATSKVTQSHIDPVPQPSVPKIAPSVNLNLPIHPIHHGSSIAGPTLGNYAAKTQPIVYTHVPQTAAHPQHDTLTAGPQPAIKTPVLGRVQMAPAVGTLTHHDVLTTGHQSSLVHQAVKTPPIVQAHAQLPIAIQSKHVAVPAPASLPLATQPQIAALPAQFQLPIVTQPKLTAVLAQAPMPIAIQPQIAAVPAQAQLPVVTKPQLAAVPAQVPLPVATQPQYAAVPQQALLPVVSQPQYAPVAQPAQVDPTQSLHEELVAALVAVLEGKVSPAAASAVAAPVAASPAHIPAQHIQPATNQYLGQTAQFGFGGNMYMPQSMYGYQQPMYPAHMYPAYMQEMLFGDTQDPPDPTVATPNTTTSAPVVTTVAATADPVTATEAIVSSTAEPVVIEATTPEIIEIETTTEASPTEPTIEPIPESTTENTSPTESVIYDTTPMPTEIPMPYEKKQAKKAPSEPATKTKIEKIKAIAKAVKGLQGQMSAETKQKLLLGIKKIVSSSSVDLASLKSSLSMQLSKLKTNTPAVEYASPDQITDSPSAKTKTTLPPPSTPAKTSPSPLTTPIPVAKSIGQKVDSHKKIKIRSLVDSGTASGTSTLESILKSIVSQSNGNTLPPELKHVNFAEIARSLTPEGTDLATQLADPNFVKLLKEVVSNLHSIAHAPADTPKR